MAQTALSVVVLGGTAFSLGGPAQAADVLEQIQQVAGGSAWGYVSTSDMFHIDSGSGYVAAPSTQAGSSNYGSVDVRRQAGSAHKYTVRFAGLGAQQDQVMPGVVHVTKSLYQVPSPGTSLNSNGDCIPSSPYSSDGDLLVDVRCYDRDNRPDMNANFALTYAQGAGIEGAGDRTIVRVDNPPAPLETAPVQPPVQASTTGQPAKVLTAGEWGSYIVKLPVLAGPSSFTVTAIGDSGSDKSCNLGSTAVVFGSPAVQEVRIKCFNPRTGAPVTSGFSLTHVAQTNLVGARSRLSAAHVWVPLVPVSDDVTSPSIRYNRIYGAESGQVLVLHAAKGKYSVLLGNQQWSISHSPIVMVTAQQSTASCLVEPTNHIQNGPFQTAFIVCRDGQRNYVDTGFHLAFMATQ
ncbi:hypothetical protein OG985_49055 (plasmid) [Streptomyces sp. NBC_00289]|uniref:hypothetical protein n=1 Tax=Streptomyces sp. NBC_00289 TaxID=2975703 RepID=UPI003244E4E2